MEFSAAVAARRLLSPVLLLILLVFVATPASADDPVPISTTVPLLPTGPTEFVDGSVVDGRDVIAVEGVSAVAGRVIVITTDQYVVRDVAQLLRDAGALNFTEVGPKEILVETGTTPAEMVAARDAISEIELVESVVFDTLVGQVQRIDTTADGPADPGSHPAVWYLAAAFAAAAVALASVTLNKR